MPAPTERIRRPSPVPSIRRILTLWYAGSLAVLLCLFGSILYATVASSLIRDLDRVLVLQAAGLADTIATFWRAEQGTKAASPGNWLRAPAGSLQSEVARGRLPDLVARWAKQTGALQTSRPVRLLTRQGVVLAASSGVAEPAVSASPEVLAAAQHGAPASENLEHAGHRVHLLVYPVVQGGEVLYLIEAASPMDQVDEWLRRLRTWLLILIPMMVALTGGVGWWLASRALRPVGDMIAQARRISAERLDQRLDVARTGDELEQLGVTFNQMLARLQQAFHRLRQFSAAASHELRTPLTVMRGELEVTLRKERTVEQYQRVLHTHLEAIADMTRTVETLLALARHGIANGVVDWRPVELQRLVQRAHLTWTELAKTTSVQLDLIAPRPCWVRGEEHLLERLVTNLLDNAIKHTPPDGRIVIRMEERGGSAQVRVEDTGPGIAPEELPHIFDRFFRQRQPLLESRVPSTGLGLGLCRWIAEIHQGRIDVSSRRGQGTVFTVSLPTIATPSTRAPAAPAGALPAPDGAGGRSVPVDARGLHRPAAMTISSSKIHRGVSRDRVW